MLWFLCPSTNTISALTVIPESPYTTYWNQTFIIIGKHVTPFDDATGCALYVLIAFLVGISDLFRNTGLQLLFNYDAVVVFTQQQTLSVWLSPSHSMWKNIDKNSHLYTDYIICQPIHDLMMARAQLSIIMFSSFYSVKLLIKHKSIWKE